MGIKEVISHYIITLLTTKNNVQATKLSAVVIVQGNILNFFPVVITHTLQIHRVEMNLFGSVIRSAQPT